MTQQLTFLFYLMLIDLNLRSHMWLLAAVLESTDVEQNSELSH